MKKIRELLKPLTLSLSIGILTTSCLLSPENLNASVNETTTNSSSSETTNKKKIQIALLLDTSNSMDGLIDQAKSQLWSLVNELGTASCDGEKPQLQIGLYQYGNSGLSTESGYIQQVSSFTGELDEISAKLFSLSTNGGDEYCGQVIQKSLDQLQWTDSDQDLRFIFIAGNEAFSQGSINYVSSCSNARNKDIVINTIFCGDFQSGINLGWQNGAIVSNGEYMSINHNQKTVFIPSPYDKRIDSLNTRLNDTYIDYGSHGHIKKEQQKIQDFNAESISPENKVSRAVSKSNHFYKNESWDLVDKADGDDIEKVLEEVEEDELNNEMRLMSKEERVIHVKAKTEERQKIQSEINSLNTKRKTYVAENTKTEAADLNSSMLKSIKENAKAKNYVFK